VEGEFQRPWFRHNRFYLWQGLLSTGIGKPLATTGGAIPSNAFLDDGHGPVSPNLRSV
jgi:hypothetical protein